MASDAQKKAAVAKILAGKATQADIAEKFEVTGGAVWQWTRNPKFLPEGAAPPPPPPPKKAGGVPGKRIKRTREFKEELVGRVAAGETCEALGREHGIAPNLIRYWASGRGLDGPGGREPFLDPAVWEPRRQIVERWAAGESPDALSREAGVHAVTIRQWAKKLGIARPELVKKRAPNPIREEVLRRYAAGEPGGPLSAEFQIPEGTLRAWIRRYGSGRNGSSPQPELPLPRMEPVRPAASEIEPATNGETEPRPVVFSSLPTKPISAEMIHRNKRIPRRLIASYSCPHCSMGLPPPPRPGEGALIPTQFLCPHCTGTVTL